MSKSTKNKKTKSQKVAHQHESPTDHQAESSDQDQVQTEQDTHETATESTDDSAPIRVEFPYSDVVRSYVPDAMAIADKALGDWKTEGSFMNLGIENPYANMAVSLGLQNAKKIEKKLEEKGVLPVVRMGFEVLKSKVSKQK